MSLKPLKNYRLSTEVEEFIHDLLENNKGSPNPGGGGNTGSGCKQGYNTGKTNPCYCGNGYTFGGK